MAEAEKQSCAEIIWKIENFTYCWQEKRKYLTSSKFFVQCLDKTSWHLCLFPKGDSRTDNLGLFLQRAEHDEGSETVQVYFELAVLKDGNVSYEICISGERPFSPSGSSGKSSSISRSDIIKDAEKLCPKNVLSVRCKMWHVNAEEDCSTTLVHLRTIIPVTQCLFEWNIDLDAAEMSDQEKVITMRSLFGSENSLQAKLSFIKHLENIFLKIFITGNMLKEYSFKCDMQTVPAKKDFFLKLCKIYDLPFEIICRPILTHKYCVETSQKSLVAHGHSILRLNCEFAIISHEVKNYNFQSNLVTESEKSSEWYPRLESNCDHGIIRSLESTVTTSKPDHHFSVLKSDVLKMYQEGLKSDFTLQVESQTFPVHSCILSSRSAVLDRMFDTEMKEKQEKILKIEDLDGNTIKKMLDYVYTDSPGELDIESANKLYYAADKYELFGLKKLCCEYLMQNIAICNLYDILMVAHRHNDEDLKSSAIQFIAENEKDVVLSDQFKTFTKNHLEFGREIVQGLFEYKFKG